MLLAYMHKEGNWSGGGAEGRLKPDLEGYVGNFQELGFNSRCRESHQRIFFSMFLICIFETNSKN